MKTRIDNIFATECVCVSVGYPSKVNIVIVCEWASSKALQSGALDSANAHVAFGGS